MTDLDKAGMDMGTALIELQSVMERAGDAGGLILLGSITRQWNQDLYPHIVRKYRPENAKALLG